MHIVCSFSFSTFWLRCQCLCGSTLPCTVASRNYSVPRFWLKFFSSVASLFCSLDPYILFTSSVSWVADSWPISYSFSCSLIYSDLLSWIYFSGSVCFVTCMFKQIDCLLITVTFPVTVNSLHHLSVFSFKFLHKFLSFYIRLLTFRGEISLRWSITGTTTVFSSSTRFVNSTPSSSQQSGAGEKRMGSLL